MADRTERKKRTAVRVITLIFTIALSLCFAASAAEQGDGVAFMSVSLPSLDTVEQGSEDTPVGSFAADACRSASGSDFAIVVGGDLSNDLLQGEVTRADAEAVFSHDRELAEAQVTPMQLKALLEELLKAVTTDPDTERIDRDASAFDGFPNVSGFTLKYDVTAPVGDRVYSVTLEDGTDLDLTDDSTEYTLTAAADVLDGLYGGEALPYETLGIRTSEALYDYIAAVGRELKSVDWQRVSAIGAYDNNIVGGMIPAKAIVLAVIALIAVNFLFRHKLSQ